LRRLRAPKIEEAVRATPTGSFQTRRSSPDERRLCPADNEARAEARALASEMPRGFGALGSERPLPHLIENLRSNRGETPFPEPGPLGAGMVAVFGRGE
jgi:hypothetical protein